MKYLLITAVLISLPSCSWKVYSSGKHRDILMPGTPRNKVISELGAPHATQKIQKSDIRGRVPGQERLDIWNTTDRFPDPSALGAGMLGVMTLGLSEIYLAPRSWYEQLIKHRRELTVWYGSDDRVTRYFVRRPGRGE